jgi:hypothetical protein
MLKFGSPTCCIDEWNGSAINRDLEKKRGKHGNSWSRCPPFARKRINRARFQPDRTEIRDLTSGISIEKDVVHFEITMQQPAVVRKSKVKCNSRNRFCFRNRRRPGSRHRKDGSKRIPTPIQSRSLEFKRPIQWEKHTESAMRSLNAADLTISQFWSQFGNV